MLDVGEVIEDQEVVLVELGERAFESELTARHLQALHEIGGTRKEHAPAVLDESESDRCRQMTLAGDSWLGKGANILLFGPPGAP